MDAQPPYEFQPQPYGASAPHGYGFGPPAEPPPMPGSVRAAVALMWVGAVLTILNALLFPLYVDEMRAEFRRQQAATQGETGIFVDVDGDSFVRVTVIILIIVTLIEVGLWVWMAVKTRQGRNWARALSTVLGTLSVVFVVLGFAIGSVAPTLTADQDVLSRVLSVIGVVLALTIVVLLWVPDSNRWFAARRDEP